MEIKAIETVYNGYRFRSRLEARWAVFFDSAGIKYEYEPEGFQTPDGTMYLPDFYLPELDTYCEVKGERPEAWEEIKKIYSTITWGGPIKRVLILGNVPATANRMGGLWHFPCLYWDGGDDEVCCGWWFFFDRDDDEPATGTISGANYRHPWWINYDGKFVSYGRKELSFQPVSDTILREESPWIERVRWEEMTDEEREMAIILEKNSQDACYLFNKRTFDSFDKARQARFEHGEMPTTNN